MNKHQKELLNKCIRTSFLQELPLFDEIYILPTTRKHDSGYKIMYVIGKINEINEYYLLDTSCDVVNFGFPKHGIDEINIDIEHPGIIRYWSYYQQFKSVYRLSICTFEFVDRR